MGINILYIFLIITPFNDSESSFLINIRSATASKSSLSIPKIQPLQLRIGMTLKEVKKIIGDSRRVGISAHGGGAFIFTYLDLNLTVLFDENGKVKNWSRTPMPQK